MRPSPFAVTPIERVAIATILEDRAAVIDALSERLRVVLADLARTSQGWVVTEAQVDELFLQLRGEFVSRMMAEMEAWGRTRISGSW